MHFLGALPSVVGGDAKGEDAFNGVFFVDSDRGSYQNGDNLDVCLAVSSFKKFVY